MFEIVYQGIDTLDVTFQGALPIEVLDQLEAARNAAEALPNDKHGVQVLMGPDNRRFFVKSTGKKGGYRYTLIDDPTGAIYYFKRETRLMEGNIFVSARAQGILCRTYDGIDYGYPSGGGAGLGLAISKSIVESLGGTIDYETVMDVGTTFSFTLPLTAEDPA